MVLFENSDIKNKFGQQVLYNIHASFQNDPLTKCHPVRNRGTIKTIAHSFDIVIYSVDQWDIASQVSGIAHLLRKL